MRKIQLIILQIILLSQIVVADEGMWIPLFLEKYNIEDMHKKGFKLSAKDIYDVNQASLKDAVMIFGGGCTGELISDKGLILTNYHCGYGSIQRLSSVEHDYLTDGFWAMSQEQELPSPGLTVTFLKYMEDVTKRVSDTYNEDMPMTLRQKKIDSVCKVIETEAVEKSGGKYIAKVEPFFYGNQYILIVSQVFKDIRLVGAPPSAIGKFGGDTDNWVWPRHTGDFSMFRIYADKNNEPAPYSPDNVPYKPQKFFSINISGVHENDFTMIFGYPGYTQEYIPSYLVGNIINVINPLRISVRQAKLDIIDEAMNSDKKIRIQYASKQAGIANGWKKWIGQNQGLKRLNILKEKQNFEQKFQEWADNQGNDKYKNLLKDYKKYSKDIVPYQKAYYYFIETAYYSDLWKIYRKTIKRLNEINNLSDDKQIDSIKSLIYKSIDNYFDDYNQNVDKKIFKATIKLYFSNVRKDFLPDFYNLIQTEYNDNIDAFADTLYETSVFTDKQRLTDFVSGYYNGSSKYKRKHKKTALYTSTDLQNDLVVIVLDDFISKYNYKILPQYIKLSDKIDSLNHLYMQAQMKMLPDKIFYPDANFTLRVAYGKVKGFRPRDGIIYDYYTTLDGVIAKDNPEIYDYNVPKKLKELYKNKDFGRYADKEDGKIHTCFIGDNHTTGGNSGSPVLNANGELIGVNFDRCWESTMSDIKFDPNYCRNIMLDIRYVLFIVDKYAGAGYLIDEMNIIETRHN